MQITDRANAISKDFKEVKSGSAKAVSEVAKQVGLLGVLVPFMHDNILNNKGDISEGDRLDLRDTLVPLFIELVGHLDKLTELFEIYDEDVTTWISNLNSHLVDNPNCVVEAEARYPKVV